MMTRRHILYGNLLLQVFCLLGAVLLLGGCRKASVTPGSNQSQPPTQVAVVRPVPPDNNYAGNAVCMECHAEISQEFADHPMGNSIVETGTAATLETFDVATSFQPRGACNYRVERRDGGEVHSESMLDTTGNTIFDQSVPMHFVIGSGTRGRSYVSHRQGLLFMSPLTWYTEKRRWDLSPGYRADDERRFDRRITDECVACHAGRVAHVAGHTSRFDASAPFVELSIGCENCHGPGAKHVSLRRSAATVASAEDSIVNPGRLEPELRESVCNQCHLQGAARVPRYGRTHFDFRPGHALEDVFTIFTAGNRQSEDGTTKSVSQVHQMMASACYKASDRELGCTSCHDPHRVPAAAERVEFYRDRCSRCHDNERDCGLSLRERVAHPSGNSCYECHMPKLSTRDITHAAQTDHRVLTRPAQAPRPEQDSQEVQLVRFTANRQPLPVWEQQRAALLALIEYSTEHQVTLDFDRIENEAAAVLEVVPDDTRTLAAVAWLAFSMQRFDRAEPYFQQHLVLEPTHERSLVGMAEICYQSYRFEEAVRYAAQCIEVNPWNPAMYAQYADLLRLTGRLAEGIQVAEKGIELNPRFMPLRGWLANAYRDSGRLRESADQLEIIARIDAALNAVSTSIE